GDERVLRTSWGTSSAPVQRGWRGPFGIQVGSIIHFRGPWVIKIPQNFHANSLPARRPGDLKSPAPSAYLCPGGIGPRFVPLHARQLRVMAMASTDITDKPSVLPADGPEGHQPYVPDYIQMPEFTGPAVLVGAVLGIIFGASSLYLLLK